MHMADALLSPGVAGVMYAASAVAAGHSVHKLEQNRDTTDKIIPTMGVMGAFVFAAQMINFTIPGTGSSGHLCGGMLLTAIVGPYAAFLTMIGVLLIQCLLFADGGLMALGANVWNMAFYGCFVGGLLWKAMMQRGISKRKIVVASLLGCVLTLQMGALSVSVETLASGITELPFTAFLLAMQPIHLAIGLVEGAITAAVLVFLQQARPALLWQTQTIDEAKQPLTLRRTLGIVAVAAAMTAGVLSLFASAFPDGLEWSLQRITGSTELDASGPVQAFFARIQNLTALLPDYNLTGSESAAGASAAGLIGAASLKKAAQRHGSSASRDLKCPPAGRFGRPRHGSDPAAAAAQTAGGFSLSVCDPIVPKIRLDWAAGHGAVADTAV